MKPSAVVFQSLSDEQNACLNEKVDALYFLDHESRRSEACQQALAKADGILAPGGYVLNESKLVRMPHLKAVSTISVGYDSYDVEALTQRGIVLTHTPGVLDDSVADLVLALMLSTARRVVELDEWVRQGQWQTGLPVTQFGCDVHHKTLGIIGLGRIGMAVAQRAHLGFSMSILYHARHAKPDAESFFSARRVELNELLEQSDFVVMLVPLTQETHHMIGKDQLAAMKRSAILINAARGDVVDEQALIQALEHRVIAAAGLDVFHREPIPLDLPLLSMKNVVALPHIGSATIQTRNAMVDLAISNLIQALTRDSLINCVNPHVRRQK
ncbi:MAG: Glyoxylate/hydroxypyruvate reductase B [Candidatus Celerinatantimonas neptuna]|nr:MAG: Glyoxylate/hydroxypyruvate reductase B [Candidatus Celerinatantimonas neptuna]